MRKDEVVARLVLGEVIVVREKEDQVVALLVLDEVVVVLIFLYCVIALVVVSNNITTGSDKYVHSNC